MTNDIGIVDSNEKGNVGMKDSVDYPVITDTCEIKLAALKCSDRQMREQNMERHHERPRKRFKTFGEKSGYELAEGFHQELLPGQDLALN